MKAQASFPPPDPGVALGEPGARDVCDPELARCLVLSAASDVYLTLTAWELKEPELRAIGDRVSRASRAAVVLPEGFGSLPESRWSSLLEWCGAILKPDGGLVLRFPRRGVPELGSLTSVLAGHFGVVEMFCWDGTWRASAASESADLFAICRPFVPYPMRSLELLRPRVVAGAEWGSSWLCERPALPERFLLRASVEAIGGDRSVDVRLRFMTGQRAWFRVQGRLDGQSNELLISSQRAEKRGEPRWEDVERIAIDVAASDETGAVDLRISDLRISHSGSSSRSSAGRASLHLREGYDEDYYKAMTGFDGYRDRGGLRGYVNVHRAYSLLPDFPSRAVDIGCGRGELAKHLLEGGAEVTLLDYSPAALGYSQALIGDRARARFVVDDAANLGAHVAAGSQDAIFMTDFVEHLDVGELRVVLEACRRALAAHGALVIHTPERYSGAIATAKAIHGLHVNLFEIRTLEELLEEVFEEVDVFTWNGFERFAEPGYCIELFALARPRQADPTRALMAEPVRAERVDSSRWALDRPELPGRFVLDVTVGVLPASADGVLEIAFLAQAGRTLSRITRKLSSLSTLPARLRLASELLSEQAAPDWGAVQRVEVSAETPSGAPLALVLSDARLHVARLTMFDPST